MGDRVAIISPDGKFGTIGSEFAEEVTRAGGKVLTKAEQIAHEQEEAYEAQPTIKKVAGYASAVLPFTAQNALSAAGVAPIRSEVESFNSGASSAATLGLDEVAVKEGLDALHPGAGKAYGRHLLDAREAHEGYNTAGKVAGFAAMAAMPASGAGRVLGGVGTLGGAAEQGVARGLAGVAARGTIGRALATGTELAARGAVEGTLYGAADAINEGDLGDNAADKVFAAMGTKALHGLEGGLVGGAALGTAGSLAGSGARGLAGAARSGIGRALGRGEEVAGSVAAKGEGAAAETPGIASSTGSRPTLDLDAGLTDTGSRAIEKPLKIGNVRKEVGLGDIDAGATHDAMNYPPVIGKWGGVEGRLDGKVSLHEGAGHALETEPAPLFMSKNRPVTLKDGGGGAVGDLPSPINFGSGKAAAAVEETTHAAEQPSMVRALLGGDANEAARSGANSMAFDALGTTKVIARKIDAEVPGGTKAVGDYVNRRILNGTEDQGLLSGVWDAGRNGRADQLLPRIQAELAVDGSKIGDLVRATPVRVSQDELLAKAGTIFRDMAADPTRIQGVKPFQEQVAQTFQAFTNGGKLANGSMDLGEMYYARANMERVAHEMKRGNSAAGDAMKEWLREVDGHLVTKLDEAAAASGNAGVKDQILKLKREYQLGKAAERAAQDGTNRIAGNNSIGLREGVGMAVGVATGHAIPAIAVGLGGKVLRERGSAAGAYLLTRVADMGILQRAVRTIDEHIGRASMGVLSPPRKGVMPELASNIPVRARAQAAMRKWTAVAANPEQTAERATAAGERFQNTAPNLAGALSQRMTDVAAFMIGKMPSTPDPDPFDPHPAPMLTDAQASEYAAYDYYAEDPTRFFKEAAHGKLTYEGVEVARAFMPGAFEEMKQKTALGLADLIAKKRAPSYLVEQRLGMMLGFPAVPEQRPEHAAFLQKNVVGSEKPGKATALGAQSTPKRPLATKSQSSTLDRLEGR